MSKLLIPLNLGENLARVGIPNHDTSGRMGVDITQDVLAHVDGVLQIGETATPFGGRQFMSLAEVDSNGAIGGIQNLNVHFYSPFLSYIHPNY
jgi:hypothetical protein